MKVADLTEERKRIILSLADHNMKVATTARALNYHRNSLLYHIQKIRQQIGLDPLNFHDLARMVLELEGLSSERP